MHQQQYLQRLKAIGVRTNKRLEVMYCDLFRITENIFLEECHATEAFELYDFVKKKEKFRELHELRRHLEDLLHWMHPEGLPIWPRSTNRRFRELVNPYLGADYEPLDWKQHNLKSSQWISAAFNLRCGKPGEQIRQDCELLLQKLEDRHFSAAAIKKYWTAGKDNIQIPKIGLDLMKQEIYLLKPGECFLSEDITEEAIAASWQKKYEQIFDKFSDGGLSIYYNQQVEREHKGPAQKGILAALRDQFEKRKIEFSSLGNVEELEMKQCALLIDKKLHTIEELPLTAAEGLTQMYFKDRKENFRGIKATSVSSGNINFIHNGSPGYLQANAAIKCFTKFLLKSNEEKNDF